VLTTAQQNLPDWSNAFLQNEVATIKITINPDSLAAAYNQDNWFIEREFPAVFRYESSVLTETVNNIGFRLRGNTSLFAQKKSFKVSFNTYIAGAKWQNLEKLNLIANQNDPSMIRAKLCWDAMREAGLPGARVSFVKVYINEEYKGLYSNVEHIDENFTKAYFDNYGNNNLYKCLYPASLEYINSNPNSYKLESGNRRIYELTTNDWIDDYKDLADFIQTLNLTPIDELTCKLSKRFNVLNYLKYAALDVISGNWDGYIYNKNNFYLYFDANTKQFNYLPYDLDNTLGIDWVNQDWTTRNIYNWAPSNEERPLFNRLMQVEEYRNIFGYYIQHYLETVFNPSYISSKAQSLIQLISEAAQADPYRPLDYGFSFSDFLNSINQTWGGHVKNGIFEYLIQRQQSALAQLEAITDFSGIYNAHIEHDFPFESGIKLSAKASHPNASNFRWVFSTDASMVSADSLMMHDDGSNGDLQADDAFYTLSNATFNLNQTVYYQFRATLNGTEHKWPCEPAVLWIGEHDAPIVINELMSRNSTVIADENGEFDDWIELYNKSTTSASLYGLWLTEKPNQKLLWPFEAENMPPGSYKLIWADSDEKFNRNHTNFSLSSNGEDLRLYRSVDYMPQLVQRVNFPALPQNVSYGLQTDGNLPWVQFTSPTPNQSNNTISIEKVNSHTPLIVNPAVGTILLDKANQNVTLHSMDGKLIISCATCATLPVSAVKNGIYILSISGKSYRVVVLNE
jgi:hypothetical protein